MKSKDIVDQIVTWLTEYACGASSQGFVVGISGGVDSAVCSTLAAMTGLPTLVVSLPIHQPADHLSRAQGHIEQLCKRFKNIERAELDLSESFDTLLRSMPQSADTEIVDLTNANTRSRLRMVALYYCAGLRNRLVVGTGNKIEDFGVGFFTKYGDGGVDISPIADLTKTEVYSLAEYLDVPISIRLASPSDGLFADARSDEEQIGASYYELEQAMEQQMQGVDAEQLTGHEREVFDIFCARQRANRHKMEPIPVCKINRI